MYLSINIISSLEYSFMWFHGIILDIVSTEAQSENGKWGEYMGEGGGGCGVVVCELRRGVGKSTRGKHSQYVVGVV